MRRMLWFGFYRTKVMRTRVLMNGLRRIGVEIEECHVDVRGRGRFGKFFELARKARVMRHKKYDAVVVGFPGHQIIWLAKLFFRKMPIIYDIGFSVHQAEVEDRQATLGKGLRGKLLKFYDWYGARLADRIIIDTHAHAEYLARTCGAKMGKFIFVPVGADEYVFTSGSARAVNGKFTVLFHGTFIPLHGLEIVVEAAERLQKDKTIEFRLVGDGQTAPHIRRMVEKKGLVNVKFVGRLPLEARGERTVIDEIREANLVLGVFGTGSKPDIQVPTKVFEAMAVGKPVLTARTSAVKEVFKCGHDILCSIPGDGESLADCILEARQDFKGLLRVATNGHHRFLRDFTSKRVAESFLNLG